MFLYCILLSLFSTSTICRPERKSESSVFLDIDDFIKKLVSSKSFAKVVDKIAEKAVEKINDGNHSQKLNDSSKSSINKNNLSETKTYMTKNVLAPFGEVKLKYNHFLKGSDFNFKQRASTDSSNGPDVKSINNSEIQELSSEENNKLIMINEDITKTNQNKSETKKKKPPKKIKMNEELTLFNEDKTNESKVLIYLNKALGRKSGQKGDAIISTESISNNNQQSDEQKSDTETSGSSEPEIRHEANETESSSNEDVSILNHSSQIELENASKLVKTEENINEDQDIPDKDKNRSNKRYNKKSREEINSGDNQILDSQAEIFENNPETSNVKKWQNPNHIVRKEGDKLYTYKLSAEYNDYHDMLKAVMLKALF